MAIVGLSEDYVVAISHLRTFSFHFFRFSIFTPLPPLFFFLVYFVCIYIFAFALRNGRKVLAIHVADYSYLLDKIKAPFAKQQEPGVDSKNRVYLVTLI